MPVIHAIAGFLWTNGVGQNITAAVLCAIPAGIWARRKLLPAWRAHHQRVIEIHAALTQPAGERR